MIHRANYPHRSVGCGFLYALYQRRSRSRFPNCRVGTLLDFQYYYSRSLSTHPIWTINLFGENPWPVFYFIVLFQKYFRNYSLSTEKRFFGELLVVLLALEEDLVICKRVSKVYLVSGLNVEHFNGRDICGSSFICGEKCQY